MMMSRRLATAVLGAMLLIACGSGDPRVPLESPGEVPTPATAAPAEDASIEITSPKDGDTITADEAVVEVEVKGFELVDKIGQEAQQGEGHIMYYMGAGYEIPVEPGRPANIGGSGSFTSYPTPETTYKWPNAQAGTQTFTVQLVSSDHTPLEPPQSDQVTVTVSLEVE